MQSFNSRKGETAGYFSGIQGVDGYQYVRRSNNFGGGEQMDGMGMSGSGGRFGWNRKGDISNWRGVYYSKRFFPLQRMQNYRGGFNQRNNSLDLFRMQRRNRMQNQMDRRSYAVANKNLQGMPYGYYARYGRPGLGYTTRGGQGGMVGGRRGDVGLGGRGGSGFAGGINGRNRNLRADRGGQGGRNWRGRGGRQRFNKQGGGNAAQKTSGLKDMLDAQLEKYMGETSVKKRLDADLDAYFGRFAAQGAVEEQKVAPEFEVTTTFME